MCLSHHNLSCAIFITGSLFFLSSCLLILTSHYSLLHPTTHSSLSRPSLYVSDSSPSRLRLISIISSHPSCILPFSVPMSFSSSGSPPYSCWHLVVLPLISLRSRAFPVR